MKSSICTWVFKITSIHSEFCCQIKLSKPVPGYFISRFKNAFPSSTGHSVSSSTCPYSQDTSYDHILSPCSSHQTEWGASCLPPLVLLPNDSSYVIAPPSYSQVLAQCMAKNMLTLNLKEVNEWILPFFLLITILWGLCQMPLWQSSLGAKLHYYTISHSSAFL